MAEALAVPAAAPPKPVPAVVERPAHGVAPPKPVPPPIAERPAPVVAPPKPVPAVVERPAHGVAPPKPVPPPIAERLCAAVVAPPNPCPPSPSGSPRLRSLLSSCLRRRLPRCGCPRGNRTPGDHHCGPLCPRDPRAACAGGGALGKAEGRAGLRGGRGGGPGDRGCDLVDRFARIGRSGSHARPTRRRDSRGACSLRRAGSGGRDSTVPTAATSGQRRGALERAREPDRHPARAREHPHTGRSPARDDACQLSPIETQTPERPRLRSAGHLIHATHHSPATLGGIAGDRHRTSCARRRHSSPRGDPGAARAGPGALSARQGPDGQEELRRGARRISRVARHRREPERAPRDRAVPGRDGQARRGVRRVRAHVGRGEGARRPGQALPARVRLRDRRASRPPAEARVRDVDHPEPIRRHPRRRRRRGAPARGLGRARARDGGNDGDRGHHSGAR